MAPVRDATLIGQAPSGGHAEEGPSFASVRADGAGPRRLYDPPELEALGRFRALTLQQSVPIGPGG